MKAALRGYWLLLVWQALRMRQLLAVIVVVQALLATGIVIGFGFLVPEVDPTLALYLSTGAPTLMLVTVGLVIVPQQVSRAKTEGSYTYTRSLPVPRLAFLAADTTVWVLSALPGVVLALAVGALRYDLDLSVTPLVLPAVLLVALTATGVGYAIATLLHPMTALLLSQILVFAILMFSPINFPADRLPGWLASLHQVLPLQAMADVMRGALASRAFPTSSGPFLLLAAWCAAGLGASCWALTRRS